MPDPEKVSLDLGRVTLYCGDCLQVLPGLPAGSVDCIVTDPPYGINHVTSRGATWEGNAIAGDNDTSARDCVLAWADSLPWAVWGSYKTPAPAGFKAKIVWNKGPAFGAGDLSFPWKPSFEECWFSAGPWKAERRGEGVWSGPVLVSWQTVAGGRLHPHQKPVWLFERIIKALPTTYAVLDPFMGVGSTIIAAIRTNRRAIGIEIDPGYFAIARRRIEAELANRDSRGPLIDAAAGLELK